MISVGCRRRCRRPGPHGAPPDTEGGALPFLLYIEYTEQYAGHNCNHFVKKMGSPKGFHIIHRVFHTWLCQRAKLEYACKET